MVKYTLKILQHLLQNFQLVFDLFVVTRYYRVKRKTCRSSHLQMFFKIGILKSFAIFTWKIPVLESPLESAKNGLKCRYFLVNIAKSIRIPFLYNTPGGYFWTCSKVSKKLEGTGIVFVYSYKIQTFEIRSVSRQRQ